MCQLHWPAWPRYLVTHHSGCFCEGLFWVRLTSKSLDSFFLRIGLFVYLILAVLGLCCYAKAFSSCRKWGLGCSCSVRASHCGCFSNCRAPALGGWGSVIATRSLQSTSSIVVVHNLVAVQHVGSSQTRDWTHVPCITRQILNHWASREALNHWTLSKALPFIMWVGLKKQKTHLLWILQLIALDSDCKSARSPAFQPGLWILDSHLHKSISSIHTHPVGSVFLDISIEHCN